MWVRHTICGRHRQLVLSLLPLHLMFCNVALYSTAPLHEAGVWGPSISPAMSCIRRFCSCCVATAVVQLHMLHHPLFTSQHLFRQNDTYNMQTRLRLGLLLLLTTRYQLYTALHYICAYSLLLDYYVVPHQLPAAVHLNCNHNALPCRYVKAWRVFDDYEAASGEQLLTPEQRQWVLGGTAASLFPGGWQRSS